MHGAEQDGRHGGLGVVRRAAQAPFEDLLDGDALVAQFDQGTLVAAERQVPRFLDGPLAELQDARRRTQGAGRRTQFRTTA
ncbi:hypothetical protein GCM10023237_68080 [Streptomyces coeruleoprunus]